MTELTAKVGGSVGAFDRADWDALAGTENPFVSHGFLTALEDSRSVGEGTGWQPAPIVIEREDGTLLAAMPSYLKGHSQGEFVFDHSWADAYERAGGHYYPKLQIAAPFTPATGPRLLLSNAKYAAPLISAAEQLCAQNGFSSANATFIASDQVALFEKAGWLLRNDIQFHWTNRGYDDFEGFLADLSSRKRKDLRKERLAAQADVTIQRLRGKISGPNIGMRFGCSIRTPARESGARRTSRARLSNCFRSGWGTGWCSSSLIRTACLWPGR